MARRPKEEAPAPESDRVEGLPHPREIDRLMGLAGARQTLTESLARDAPHGWILVGPRGAGKASLAYWLAQRLLAPGAGERVDLSAPPDPATRRLIAAGSHPGLLTLRRPWDATAKRFKSDLPVDEVRRLHGFFGKTATGGGWRIAIVDTADDMNANAANALLKILEEPPRRALLLLLSAAPGRLLPTIRSRTRTLRLEPLARSEMRALLAAMAPELAEDDVARLLTLAEGCPGEALRLAQGDGLGLLARIDACLAALPATGAGVQGLAAELGARGADDSFSAALDL
ncbi:MAG: DNA polymerase III subunit delta', partial [Alphaproteobacteria bacterium]|nr:DNA polymerase III subunit delta' [Alphaproteobacteria bacterium]